VRILFFQLLLKIFQVIKIKFEMINNFLSHFVEDLP